MNKSKFIIIIVLFLSLKANSQDVNEQFNNEVCYFNCSMSINHLINSCASDALINNGVKDFFSRGSAYIEFDNMVKKMLDIDKSEPFDLQYEFIYCPSTCNAASVLDNLGKQIIYYNPEFLFSLKGDDKKVQWIVRGIIAHEIGHHLLKHTGRKNLKPAEKRKVEREADYFSGFLLSQYDDASENDALAAINSINLLEYRPKNDDEEKVSLYPTIASRSKAVKEGFRGGRDKVNKLTLPMFKKLDSVAHADFNRYRTSSIYRLYDKRIVLGEYYKVKTSINNSLKGETNVNKIKQLNEYKSLAEVLENDQIQKIILQRKILKEKKEDVIELKRLQELLKNGNETQIKEADRIKKNKQNKQK
ncbi:MAG: ImmA/IrrE family metallo-endopeptidase [Flavobacterium sp.]